MGIQNTVSTLFRGSREDGILHECRRCGTGVDREVTACHVCGSTEIATYDIE